MAATEQPAAGDYVDLNAFQRDTLWAIFHEGGAEYGLAIKEALEAGGYTDVHHSRLYQNLDSLADRGLIEKSALDDRTNEYSLTKSATSLLADRQSWERGEHEV